MTSAPNRWRIRSTITSTWICDRPATICSAVCGSRCRSIVGSSSCRRRSAVKTLSSSPLDFGSMAKAMTGAGSLIEGIEIGWSRAASQSPARVSLSLATVLDGRREVVDDRVEQAVGGQARRGHAAGHGEDVPVVGAVLERGDDLLVGDVLALEVALHERLGVLGHLVHQLLAVLLGEVG